MPAPCLAVAATGKTPCTEWPRTVMRGGLRKLTSGPDSVPKPARRTEPSPRLPRLAANALLSGRRKVKGVSRGDIGNRRCPTSPFAPAVGTASPPPDGGNALAMPWRTSPGPGGPISPPAAHRCIGGKVCRLLQIKQKGHSSPAAASRRNGGTASPLLTVSQAKREPFGSL